MPAKMADVPKTVTVFPGDDAVDYLTICRSLSLSPDLRDLQSIAVDLPDADDVTLEDVEGVPLIRIRSGASTWLSPASPRPFARLHVQTPHPFATTHWIDTLPTAETVEHLLGQPGPQCLLATAPTVATRGRPSSEALTRSCLAAVAGTKIAVRVAPMPASAPMQWRKTVLAELNAEQGSTSGAVAPAVETAAVGGRPRRGAVILFTGLSGSGKSTVARALRDHIVEAGTRPVSLLDGDAVRRTLSAGLGFSAADRERNIERLGWVAAQIAAHGGLAIASPIAPFAHTRERVRHTVHACDADIYIVHVATPLAECERRDRKGLYARARAGNIPDFTGISSPYEAPESPDLRIDTTNIDVATAVGEVVDLLEREGHLS